jgi:hypothetical protein
MPKHAHDPVYSSRKTRERQEAQYLNGHHRRRRRTENNIKRL